MEQFKQIFFEFTTINGRMSRRKYWWFVLLTICLFFTISTVTSDFTTTADVPWDQIITPYAMYFGLFMITPLIAATIRRLHDSSRTSWNLLWMLVPIVGWAYVLLLLCFASTTGLNKYDK